MKVYTKSIFKDITTNLSRFIAIIAIVTLGVGFLVGLMSSNPDMKAGMDKYYDEYLFHDIKLKSTIGFSDETIKMIENLYDDVIVEGYYEVDQELVANSQKVVGRIINKNLSNTNVDKLKLIEGRFPKNENECVIERNNNTFLELNINSYINIDDDNYKIVGVVANPSYVAKEKEPTTIGNGRIGCIVYLDSEYNSLPLITDISIVYKSLLGLNSFNDDYIDEIVVLKSDLELELENVLDKRKSEVYDSVYNTIYAEVYNSFYDNIISELLSMGFPVEAADIKAKELIANQTSTIDSETKKLVDESLNLEDATIYLLDRESNPSYVNYDMRVQMIADISLVFPIFFFIIASLVTLTTITRMVDEDRSTIGTLKALGYSKLKILSKYIIYIIMACGIGSITGVLCGTSLLPYIIKLAYDSMYFIEEFNLLFHWHYILISVVSMLVVIMLVTIGVCLNSVNEKPSALLLGRAPKPGKRIFLEYIPFLWNRLKFKYKSSIRNVFRYKKNFFVMVLGVGGCSALLLCALSIKPSLNVGSRQYDEIFKYNMIVNVNDNDLSNVYNLDVINNYILVEKKTAKSISDVTLDCEIIYTTDKINDFICFTEDGKEIKLKNDSVIITQQIAEENNLKIGDLIKLEVNKTEIEYTITNICFNHLENYVYVGCDSIDNPNTLFAIADISVEVEDKVMETLLAFDNVDGVEFTSQTRQTFDNLINTLDYVVIVVIAFSGALAIVVIYNLTNINVNERIRELATLKVLGYQAKEAAGYIYREIIIMTIIGSLVGLVLGKLLLSFILYTISGPGLYYVTNISWYSYLGAFLFTIGFSLVVDLLFIKKIKNIKMVESLKSVD